jgi:O-antigen/teichoic acid export membrane protein
VSEGPPEPPASDSGDNALPEKFGRNVLANYGTVLVMLVVALFTTPLLARGLGPERFGIWAMVGSIIPYLEVLELGFASTTIAMLARHLASGEHAGAHAIVNTSLFLLIIPGVLCFAAAGGVALVLPHIVAIPSDQVTATRILVLLLGFDMALSIPGDTFGGGLIALQRWDLLNASLAAVTLVQGIAWFIVIQLGGGLVALGVATIVPSFLGQFARYIMFRRLLPELTLTPKAFDRKLVRSFARLSGWFSFAQVVSLASTSVDILVVGVVVGVTQAGIFAVGQRLAMLAGNTVGPITGLFQPASAASLGRGDNDNLGSMIVIGGRVAMAVAVPAGLVTAVLARSALRAWVGPVYVEATTVVLLLTAGIVIQAATQTTYAVFAGIAEPKVPSLLAAAEVSVRLALAVILGNYFGIVGVAWAVFISILLFEGIAMMVLMAVRYRVRIRRYLSILIRAHALPVLFAGAAGLYLEHGPLWDFVQSHARAISILSVIAAGLVMLAIYAPIYFFTALSARERLGVIGRARTFLRRTD